MLGRSGGTENVKGHGFIRAEKCGKENFHFGALEAAEKPYKHVILSAAKDLAFVKQTTYEILRRLRFLRVTGPRSFSAACNAI